PMRNERAAWRRRKVIVVALVGLLTTACLPSWVMAGPRPEAWASPLAVSAGLPNLHRVSSNLYRSAQPATEGFEFLDKQTILFVGDQPIETILSLRAFKEDASRVPSASKLRLEQIRFKTWHPEDEDVIKFLRIATTPELQPVLVHCQHGS